MIKVNKKQLTSGSVMWAQNAIINKVTINVYDKTVYCNMIYKSEFSWWETCKTRFFLHLNEYSIQICLYKHKN